MANDGHDERNEPIAELSEMGLEPSEGFAIRLRRRIDRRETVNHVVWILWQLPAAALMAFLEIIFGLFDSNRTDGGGAS